MEAILFLLAAYGVCFGLQNKISFIWDRFDWLNKLLLCTYCTGFHAGWMVWAMLFVAEHLQIGTPVMWSRFGEVPVYAFASAAFGYMADAAGRLIEARTPPAPAAKE